MFAGLGTLGGTYLDLRKHLRPSLAGIGICAEILLALCGRSSARQIWRRDRRRWLAVRGARPARLRATPTSSKSGRKLYSLTPVIDARQ
jgi:hypothetical protein